MFLYWYSFSSSHYYMIVSSILKSDMNSTPENITYEIKNAVVGFMNPHPPQNLQVVANEFDIAKSIS